MCWVCRYGGSKRLMPGWRVRLCWPVSGERFYASIPEAAARFVQTDRIFEADATRAGLYAARHQRYRALYEPLKAIRGQS